MILIKTADDFRLLRLQKLMDEAGEPFAFAEFDPLESGTGVDNGRSALTNFDGHHEFAVIAGAEERAGKQFQETNGSDNPDGG